MSKLLAGDARAVFRLLAVAAALGLATGCDDSIGDVEGGGLEGIDKDTPKVRGAVEFQDAFVFPKLSIGQTDDATVELRNVGTGSLKIRSFDLEVGETQEFQLFWALASDDRQRNGITFEDGNKVNHFPNVVTIEAGDTLILTMNYAPVDEEVDGGRVVLDTNLPVRKVAVPIRVSDAGAEIQVNPRTVDFGRVPATEESDETVTVTNIGFADLNIEQILLNGSQDFTPLINGKDPRRQPEILEDPDGDGNPGLGPEQSFEITVRYAPAVEGPDSGELSIFSTDPSSPEIKIDLRANGATPCMEVTPPALEFRTSLVNRTDSRPLNIESCGGEQLEITNIYLADDSDPAFALDPESLPEFPALLPAANPDQAPPSRGIHVQFTPREQRIYNGTLIIESNDPVHPQRRVSLLGRGVLNACPQARAAVEEFNVLPLDVVVLDGSQSIDQDGPNNRPVSYEWVVTSRPEGSLSQPSEGLFNNQDPAAGGPPDDMSTPTASFWVDLAGTYTLELRVTDNLGLDSIACENPAVVTIVAKPDEAIHVQLVWRTPNDPDETDDQGADLDLHMLHPSAQGWFQSPYDCHYANPTPDWGQLENPADDPSLDIDDINGGGPENINLAQPENTVQLGAPYLVGVHYYSSHDRRTQFDYGASFARVRIFLNGELTWDGSELDPAEDELTENFEKEMQAEDHFWDVAQIEWPAATVTSRNRYYTQRP